MRLTRRGFLTQVGQAGGFSATVIAMQSLGLMPARAMEAPSFAAAPGNGTGVKVVILGGGIAGLVAAYEMRALGYECTVLEARERPGGRNWTVRGGDSIRFVDGTTQTCEFSQGNYQNVGPARLPSVHKTILGYCKKLGVELQVEVNTSRSSFLQNDAANGGKPVVQRQAINDTRGHVSELLMKCMNKGALDAEMDKTDRDRMLTFLRQYGSLDDAGKYVGGDRAGYKVLPGAGDQTGVPSAPIGMHTLLDENFWQGMLFEETFDMQATMFQPVGGMDRIPYAFAKELGDVVQYNSPVTEIRKTGKGVRIGYKQGDAAKTVEADYCICAMPLTILKKTPNDFSAPFKKVIEECTYANAYKVAWESRRFWEQDYNIYGGLEFVNTGCSPIWFPSANMFADRGVLVSGYTDETNQPFRTLTLKQKYAESRKSIERLHPGHGHELEKPIYVGWQRVPYNEGSWIRSYGPGQERATDGARRAGSAANPPANAPVGSGPGTGVAKTGGPARPGRAVEQTSEGYETLIQPDGPIYFAGCHVSHIVAWQEGAALSSLRAIGMINEKVKASRA
jgi:monoamine oxidase